MTKDEKNAENLPAGPELDLLIAQEIFGAIPLTDDEWDIARAVYVMCHGPNSIQMDKRFIRMPLDEPQYQTGLMFYLRWPSDYSRDAFGAARDVVNKMRQDGWKFRLADGEERDDNLAAFWKGDISGHGRADQDALAICRAALAAVRNYRRLIANTR